MKTFSDKENLAKKVKLLQQKREWSNVAELKEMVEVSLVSMFDCVTFLGIFSSALRDHPVNIFYLLLEIIL